MPYIHLTSHERYCIVHMHAFKMSIRMIADRLLRSPSTISRELKRNKPPYAVYWYAEFWGHTLNYPFFGFAPSFFPDFAQAVALPLFFRYFGETHGDPLNHCIQCLTNIRNNIVNIFNTHR